MYDKYLRDVYRLTIKKNDEKSMYDKRERDDTHRKRKRTTTYGREKMCRFEIGSEDTRSKDVRIECVRSKDLKSKDLKSKDQRYEDAGCKKRRYNIKIYDVRSEFRDVIFGN